MTRIVRCTIEMELIEGQDFNSVFINEDIITEAETRFCEMVATMYEDDLKLYIQSQIVEESS